VGQAWNSRRTITEQCGGSGRAGDAGSAGLALPLPLARRFRLRLQPLAGCNNKAMMMMR